MDKDNKNNTITTAEVDTKTENVKVDPKVGGETEEEQSKRDKFFSGVSQKINSMISKQEKTEEKDSTDGEKPGIGKIPLNWKKLLPFSPLLIIIIFALYVQLFGKTKPTTQSTNLPPTPTYSPYQKYKPSVYADDPQVNKLEEDLSVLQREMQTTPLTEGTLVPPVLDFKISF